MPSSDVFALSATGIAIRDPATCAWFLDFDGTLVDLAPTPASVVLSTNAHRVLSTLYQASGGAIAILSGRDIHTIDDYLGLVLPAAGVHGAERRDAQGRMHLVPSDDALCEPVKALVVPLVAREPGLLVERKRGAVALHYRGRPDLEADCLRVMDTVANGLSGYRLKRGKFVVECVPATADKGAALKAFMAEPPFAGRIPVVAGDDVTDEDAFSIANAMGGVTIRIGPGATAARYRMSDPAAFLTWLDGVASGADR